MRYLRDCEKKNIYEMDKLVGLFIKYLNSFKKVILLVGIVDILLFASLYIKKVEINKIIIWESVFSIIAFLSFLTMYLLCKVYRDIEKDKIGCVDVNVINKITKRAKKYEAATGQEMTIDYIIVAIDDVEKEIEYDGREFDKLKPGDKIVLIEYIFFNKKRYMCFSYNELNKM